MVEAAQAWSSGRVLTIEQRSRKRERDRHNQRDRKNASSRRLAELEAALRQQLEHHQQDRSQLEQQRSQITQLQLDVSRLHAEKSHLTDQANLESESAPLPFSDAPSRSAVLTSVQLVPPFRCLFRPHLQSPASPGAHQSHKAPNVTHALQLDSQWMHNSAIAVSSPPSPGPSQSATSKSAPAPAYPSAGLTKTFLDFSQLPFDTQRRPCCLTQPIPGQPGRRLVTAKVTLDHCSLEMVDGKLTNLDDGTASISRLINWAFAQSFLVPSSSICVDDARNQDMLLRAVIYGWDSVIVPGNTCPVWGLIRIMDDHILCFAGHINRLAYLRLVHYMMLFQAVHKTPSALPPWYRPRPIQYREPHDIVVGYLLWPQLRERFIVSGQKSPSNQLWIDSIESFLFHWPDANPASIYHFDHTSGLYRYHGNFLSAICDIRRFSCHEQFWAKYPALYDDIVPAAKVPLQIDYPPQQLSSGKPDITRSSTPAVVLSETRELLTDESDDVVVNAGVGDDG